jgi:hypothetical protein
MSGLDAIWRLCRLWDRTHDVVYCDDVRPNPIPDPGGGAMTPTVDHAESRAIVRLPDGRTATLIAIPRRANHHRHGAKARVRLPGGAWLSVPTSDLEVVTDD